MQLIGKEFDYAIGAGLARIILEQFDIKRQKIAQLEEVKQFDQFGIAKTFETDIKMDDHLIFLDTFMPHENFPEISESDKKRSMEIAEYACSLL